MLASLPEPVRAGLQRLALKTPIFFRCNICGERTRCLAGQLSREEASCSNCGSTVRMRSMVHLVSKAIFGRSMPIPKFPVRKDIRGVGLSDWDGYAVPLAQKVDYTNTYYHTDPFLDITNVPDEKAGTCDFLLSTDVFEHVAPPASRAFEGARKILKPGGTLVMSVPFMTEESLTREHFPNLHKFEVVSRDSGYQLVNTLPSGEVELHDNLVFHGGPGTTLEMRLFARDSLRKELESAGFTDIAFHEETVFRYGIFWAYPWSVPVTAKAPL